MATRSHTTFQKRQKEMLRLERQREKAAKRMQRKLAAKEPGASTGDQDQLQEQVDDQEQPSPISTATE